MVAHSLRDALAAAMVVASAVQKDDACIEEFGEIDRIVATAAVDVADLAAKWCFH